MLIKILINFIAIRPITDMSHQMYANNDKVSMHKIV